MNTNDRLEATCEAVMNLDLGPIKGKLMHAASGEGWSLQRTNAVEREYRRFLRLTAAYPDEMITPSVDVDTFWHYHILDTMKYAADCQQTFGYFLHHYPYAGMDGEDDERHQIDSGERTRALYHAMFGEAAEQEARGGVATTAIEKCGTSTAYCASPGAKHSMQAGDAMAYCASPGAKHSMQAGNAMAYCASPGAKHSMQAGNALAYCASPGARQMARAS